MSYLKQNVHSWPTSFPSPVWILARTRPASMECAHMSPSCQSGPVFKVPALDRQKDTGLWGAVISIRCFNKICPRKSMRGQIWGKQPWYVQRQYQYNYRNIQLWTTHFNDPGKEQKIFLGSNLQKKKYAVFSIFFWVEFLLLVSVHIYWAEGCWAKYWDLLAAFAIMLAAHWTCFFLGNEKNL